MQIGFLLNHRQVIHIIVYYNLKISNKNLTFSGPFIMALWIFFSFAIIQQFNMEIRSGLVRQEFYDPLLGFDQIDLLAHPVLSKIL